MEEDDVPLSLLGSREDEPNTVLPRRTPRGENARMGEARHGASKPYLQQMPHAQNETQRKLEVLLNRAAHTPEFLPGAYKAAKLSDDAARLLADFIQRPSVRAQLLPLVGDIPGRKKRKNLRAGDPAGGGDAASSAAAKKRSVQVSEETGRQVRTQLSGEQVAELTARFDENATPKPAECAAMLPSLNAKGPELVAAQVSRWFDNRRRCAKRKRAELEKGADGEGSPTGAGSGKAETKSKVERRVTHKERELLEASFSQNPAPNFQQRSALATIVGITETQVTAWFRRRQNAAHPPFEASPGLRRLRNARAAMPQAEPALAAPAPALVVSDAQNYPGLLYPGALAGFGQMQETAMHLAHAYGYPAGVQPASVLPFNLPGVLPPGTGR